MPIHALSATHANGRIHYHADQAISTVASNRLSQYAVTSDLTTCINMCTKLTRNDQSQHPCSGLLFIDHGEPNCMIFVKYDGPPPAVKKAPPVWSIRFCLLGWLLSLIPTTLSLATVFEYRPEILFFLTNTVPAPTKEDEMVWMLLVWSLYTTAFIYPSEDKRTLPPGDLAPVYGWLAVTLWGLSFPFLVLLQKTLASFLVGLETSNCAMNERLGHGQGEEKTDDRAGQGAHEKQPQEQTDGMTQEAERQSNITAEDMDDEEPVLVEKEPDEASSTKVDNSAVRQRRRGPDK